MILKQIKHNGVELLVAIAVLALVMSLSLFLVAPASHICVPQDGSPLFNSIYGSLFGGRISVGTQIVSLLLLVMEVMMIILLNSDFELTRAKPSMFALVSVPIALSLVPGNTLLPEQVANVLIALGLIKAFACHGLDKATYTFFDSGLFFGVAALMCLPALMMVPVGIAAIMIFRTFKGKEFVGFLLGCLVPLLFYAAIYYLLEGSLSPISGYLASRLSSGVPGFTRAELIAVGAQGAFVLIASALMLREYPKFNLICSQAHKLLFVMFSLITVLAFTPLFGIQVLRLALLPLSTMIVTVLNEQRDSLWSDILVALFVLCFAGAQALWYV